MKRIIILALLLPVLPLFAGKIWIGHHSGSVQKIGMEGLHPGDTLAIRAGNYELGGEFRNLQEITILNGGGVVVFGAGIRIGSLSGVRITGAGVTGLPYGFRFRQFAGNAFSVESHCKDLTILHCEYDSINGNVLSADQFFSTYNGADSTLALCNTVLGNQRLVHSGPLFAGSWEAVGSFHNVVDSISFYNILIDTTLTDGNEVVGHSIYRMTAHDWIIRGGTPNGSHDVGVFMTHGNGTLYNIKRTGGWGYLWRLWNVGLNGRGESYVYNCLDLGTRNYGTIDTRIDPEDTTTGSFPPFLRGGNLHVLNNTSGNKQDALGYVSVLVIAGDYYPQNGYILEVRNNLGFHNAIRNSNGILLINTNEPLADTSNNVYTDDAIAAGLLADTVNCFIRPGSLLIDGGQTVWPVRTDIGGVRRPQHDDYDIGAREFTGSVIHHRPLRGKLPGRTLMILSVLFGTTLLISWMVIIQQARKKKARSLQACQTIH